MSIEHSAMKYPATLPERIRWHREHMGWSLAKVPGFSHTTIWKYESGKQTPTPKQLAKLAQAFGIPVEVLADTADAMAPASNQLRRAQQLLEAGQASSAYAVAHEASRMALALGDTAGLAAAERILRKAISQLSLEEIWGEILEKAPLPIIEELVNKLYLLEPVNWQLLLGLSDLLLTRGNPDQLGFGKWVRNRARVWYEIGDFATSADWYEKAPQNPEQTGYAIVLAQQLSVAETYMLRSLPIPDQYLAPSRSYLTKSDLVWELYWTIMFRQAWQERAWDRLPLLYRQALETSDPSWTPSPQVSLAGMKAMHDWHRGSEDGIQQLDNLVASAYRRPNEVIDSRTRRELWGDYIRVALATELPQAALMWATYVEKLEEQGRTGWVRYWLQWAPQQIAWHTIPPKTRATVQRLMENPPQPHPDRLLDQV